LVFSTANRVLTVRAGAFVAVILVGEEELGADGIDLDHGGPPVPLSRISNSSRLLGRSGPLDLIYATPSVSLGKTAWQGPPRG
jgi:hypothetical protein